MSRSSTGNGEGVQGGVKDMRKGKEVGSTVKFRLWVKETLELQEQLQNPIGQIQDSDKTMI